MRMIKEQLISKLRGLQQTMITLKENSPHLFTSQEWDSFTKAINAINDVQSDLEKIKQSSENTICCICEQVMPKYSLRYYKGDMLCFDCVLNILETEQ